ncbi:yqjF [Symbiodinium natans]|uniref:YqjF protein n=1 Tax=Symbiodinium natans TaxID=878477 RepID=A0A812TB05_9DINO|nr:yqjF [Symbiodinium natans]
MAEIAASQQLIAQRRLKFRFMMHDAWENALFVHWPVAPEVVAKLLPRGLEPDILEGSAWVGLVLLTERGVSAAHPLGRTLVRPIDHLGANIRTYVRHNDVPGIFFWSLECSSILASLGARLAGIPYYPASMEREVDQEPFAATGEQAKPLAATAEGFTFTFSSTRSGLLRRPTVSAQWHLLPETSGDDKFSQRATWFVERYSVYAAWPLGQGPLLLRGDVEHPQWPVQPAALDHLAAAPLLEAAGLEQLAAQQRAGEVQPHVCFSRGVGPVNFWMLEPV